LITIAGGDFSPGGTEAAVGLAATGGEVGGGNFSPDAAVGLVVARGAAGGMPGWQPIRIIAATLKTAAAAITASHTGFPRSWLT